MGGAITANNPDQLRNPTLGNRVAPHGLSLSFYVSFIRLLVQQLTKHNFPIELK